MGGKKEEGREEERGKGKRDQEGVSLEYVTSDDAVRVEAPVKICLRSTSQSSDLYCVRN